MNIFHSTERTKEETILQKIENKILNFIFFEQAKDVAIKTRDGFIEIVTIYGCLVLFIETSLNYSKKIKFTSSFYNFYSIVSSSVHPVE